MFEFGVTLRLCPVVIVPNVVHSPEFRSFLLMVTEMLFIDLPFWSLTVGRKSMLRLYVCGPFLVRNSFVPYKVIDVGVGYGNFLINGMIPSSEVYSMPSFVNMLC